MELKWHGVQVLLSLVFYESAALGTMIYNQPDAEMYVIITQDIIDRIANESLANVFVDR